MTKQAAYDSAVTAGYRVAREEFSALRQTVETDRHRVTSTDNGAVPCIPQTQVRKENPVDDSKSKSG